jgi:hypothetical protein
MTTINVRAADPEIQRAAILSNPVFLAMVTATPAQIDTYLAANVTSLAQARPILSMYGQAIAYLFNVQNPTP